MTGYWITQKGSSAHPRRSWTERDLLHGTPIQHFSLAVGPSAQRWVQPGDGILIYWPGAGNQLFMGTFEAAGPVACHSELPEGWPYAVPLRPRHVIRDRRDGLPLEEALTIGGERIRRFARGACARGLYRIDEETFRRIEEALAPKGFHGEFCKLIDEQSPIVSERERQATMARTLDIHVEIPDEVSEESLRLAEAQAKEAVVVLLQQRGELTIGEAAMDLGLTYEGYLDLLATKGLPASFDGTDASVIATFERWLRNR